MLSLTLGGKCPASIFFHLGQRCCSAPTRVKVRTEERSRALVHRRPIAHLLRLRSISSSDLLNMDSKSGAVQDGDRALIVDDLIGTGGTLCAAIKLLERVGAEVVECACVIELPELKGRERLIGKPLFVLVESH